MPSVHTWAAPPGTSGRLSRSLGVVVGVDGSQESLSALRWAADWAHDAGLPLHVIAAHQVAARSAAEHGRVTQALNSVLIRAAAAAASRHPDLAVGVDIAWSSPAAALVGVSPRAHLLVVGKRGSGGWAGLVLGSVAADVSAHAECVVVVVPERDGRAEHGGPVVLGLDAGSESAEAAEFAFRVAQRCTATLIAVHVDDTAPDTADAANAPDRRVGAAGAPEPTWPSAVDDTLLRLSRRHPDVTLERRMVSGTPAQQLCRASAGASMLVVGSRGRGGFAGLLLGSTSVDVLQAASCPVAVVRPGDLG